MSDGYRYSIRPIALCKGPSSNSLYRVDVGAKYTSVCYVWFIEGSEPRILVDAGATASFFATAGIPSTDLISIDAGLGKLGLKPRDIDIVIITHLHGDHIALARLYRNAKFIVQKKELDYAHKPHPLDANSYHRNLFDNLNLEVIDGERDIVPGVTVFLTPGHSPGGQSVEVNTAAGNAIITGFCCFMSNFVQTEDMKRKGWEVAAPGLHQDCREAYDSVLKVKQRADIIVPLHEPVFVTRESIP